MKKLLFIICLSLSPTFYLSAQNTFPTPSGNVGIGTTTPSKELEIRGGDNVGISLYNDQANYWDIINSQYGKLDFVRGKSNVFMRIDQYGNVGIGTTTTGSKLTVQGNVNIGGTGNHSLRTRHIDGKQTSSTSVDDLYLNYNTGKHVRVGFGGQNSNVYVSGNVGIGTTAPSEKLEVSGNIKTTSSNPNISIIGTGTGSYQGASLILSATGVTSGNEHASTHFLTHRGTDGTATIEFQRRNISNAYKGSLLLYKDGYGWDFRTAATTSSTGTSTNLSIKSSGYVGIGTTSPTSLLHVQSTPGNNQVAKIHVRGTGQNNAGTSNNVSLSGNLISGTADSASFDRFNVGIESWYGIGFKSSFNNKAGIIFNTRTASAFFEGNVGIGTDTPDSKLTVAGKIHAQEVKVTVNAGADFVFNDDYNLHPLEKVEKFIKTNKHLPEIASEKEMQENGILLAEMNIKLLQKIEELTLYTINQEKRINTLEKENKILKTQENRITQLEEKLTLLLNTKQ